jgi:uncharacterized protein (TIGR00266 family)
MGMDVIDYEIHGDDCQFVTITLDPGEAAVAEAGAMMFMQDGIVMETVFGDGRPSEGGWLDSLVGAGKRLITGESIFTTVFANQQGSTRKDVSFAAPHSGRIIPVHLKETDGVFICQRDAFLCGAKGVALSVAFQKKFGVGFFGGEGFIMQKLEGDGLVFLAAGGTTYEKVLQAGEVLKVDTGCVVGHQESVEFDIEQVGGIKSALFSGEGLYFAKLTGPGKVVLQSLPISRLAGRILKYAPQMGGSRGEGSMLKGIANVLGDGD